MTAADLDPDRSPLPEEDNRMTIEIDGPTDGADVLDALRAVLARYVVLPTREAADAVTLWIAATHAQPAWAHAPRLVIRGPEKRCGKSRLLDVVEATCRQPLITVNGSPAAVYRSINEDPPTLLIDEADTIFGPKTADANESLRGLLNAGHQRNRPALRYDAGSNRVETIPTFAMAALAGIGVMPDTIEDRAVVIKMRRKTAGEKVAPYRHRRDRPVLRAVAADLSLWLRADLQALEQAEPAMPIEDRAADTWEPLVIVADLAGRDWPERARLAATTFTTAANSTDDMSTRLRLLTDCRTAFGADTALPTAVLLARLNDDPESPWPTHGPAGLTAMKLGNLLRDYEIRSTNIRFPDGIQAKGYQRADFADAWARYCPPEDARQGYPSQPSQPSPPSSAPGRLTTVGRLEPSHTPQHTPNPTRRWDGSSRPTEPSRPTLTSNATPGTAGTAPSLATCIACREPLTVDDGTHTHPTCAA